MQKITHLLVPECRKRKTIDVRIETCRGFAEDGGYGGEDGRDAGVAGDNRHQHHDGVGGPRERPQTHQSSHTHLSPGTSLLTHTHTHILYIGLYTYTIFHLFKNMGGCIRHVSTLS